MTQAERAADERAKARQLRGFLEMLREKTEGCDVSWVNLMHEADAGRLVWIGKSPLPRRRSRRKKHT